MTMVDIIEVVIGNVLRVGGSIQVIDNLTSTSTTAALSANQGKELSDLIAAIPGGGGGGAVASVNGHTGVVVLVKADINLGNVDNTSDVNKPVSTAQLTAINTKEPLITAGSAGQYWRGDKTFQALDKSAVGLSNIDNTSDANKPVSTAMQTALNQKANTSSLSVVATTGAYSDLSGKPSLATVATSGLYADLTSKPTYTVLTTLPGSFAGYVDGSEIVITG